ncbi:MAG: RyR domain-containing protein [Gemmatimonadota bacterium]
MHDRDRAWLGAQVAGYTEEFPHYQRYAQILEGFLKWGARDLAPLAIVQSRPKSITSFAEKAWRKRHQYADPLHQLTDLCGARVICRTRSEVEAVSAFVEDNLEIDWENSSDCSQRLRSAEFGYRSVHYIVEFRGGGIPGFDVEIPREVLSKPAEIQIRTVVEHAYADFAHDITYKGAFRLPSSWERELAGVAAALEEADQTFSRIEEKLSAYTTNYGAYLTEDELKTEMENLEVVLELDPHNPGTAVRLAKLAHIAGDWDRAERVLAPFVDAADEEHAPQPVLRELGITCCGKYSPGSEEYARGQRYLEMASRPEFRDVDAICSLAGSWKKIDQEKARDLYRRAFEVDPYNTYALGNFLEYELRQNPDALVVARPLIRRAIDRCRAHADVRINLPWAYYDMGKFYLLLGEPFKSLDAFAKAVSVSGAPFMVETSLRSVELLGSTEAQLPGYEWVRRLLLLGLAARFPSEERLEAVRRLATEDADPIREPVLILAGGTDSSVQELINSYSRLVSDGLAGFQGTVLSGGTTQGISGLAGEVAQTYPGRIHCIGYLPEGIPEGATKDDDPARYQEIRTTPGRDFTPLEPLQGWIDLMASGVAPDSVRVLGINGGAIAGAEYRIALALGARVGLMAGSGREAGRLVGDPDWAESEGLLELPADAATVGAFAGGEAPGMPDELLEPVARAIHEEYRQERLASPQSPDPALAEWDALHPDLQNSNRAQARDIRAKLHAIGCTFTRKPTEGEALTELTEDEIETLARLEHGRWVVERLLVGWRFGEERDLEKKTNPYLVPWSELSETVKELDRQAVKKIPRFLEGQGFRVQRVS